MSTSAEFQHPARRTPGKIGWRTNPLLATAVTIELTFSVAVLLITPVADQLGHATHPMVGWLIALSSMPIVLAVDRIDKHRRRRAAQASSVDGMPQPGREPARGSR